MRLLTLALFLFVSTHARADQIIRIESGGDHKSYSTKELRERVWRLERAVWQLQQRVFELEGKPAESNATWLCKVEAMGEMYTATGTTKALATDAAIEKCKKRSRNGSSFFCKEPFCSQ